MSAFIQKIGIIFLIIAFVGGCTWFRDPIPAKEQSEKNGKGSGASKSTAVQNLEKENAALRRQLEKLEQRLESYRLETERRLKHMDNSISLMELNIQDISKAEPVEDNSLKEKRSSSAKKGSSFEGIRTPSESKAIESFSLIPTPKVSSKKKTASAPAPQVAKKPEPKPKPKPKPKVKKRKPKSTKVVAAATKKKKKKPAEKWEDHDLERPKSPIILEVLPGAKSLYKTAFKSYSRRQFTDAILEFGDFLNRFPNDQDADNSQFWIGQAYFYLKDYAEAESAFRKVLRNYEHGNTREGYKTPDAILMIGQIYLKRNKPIKARYYFRHILQNYPQSRSAEKARREIQSLKSF